MSCIIQKNERNVREKPERAIMNASHMHVGNCCSNLKDPKCSTFAITETHSESLELPDDMPVRFYPAILNQGQDGVMCNANAR